LDVFKHLSFYFRYLKNRKTTLFLENANREISIKTHGTLSKTSKISKAQAIKSKLNSMKRRKISTRTMIHSLA
jgi:cytidylate kinase